jgi:transcriptional regulator with GAF, ATPase, and Fis domain
MEQWAEIRARHRREKIELLQSLAQSNFSYRVAADVLGINKEALVTAAKHYGVEFDKYKSHERKVSYIDD